MRFADISYKLVTTLDGSHTLYHNNIDEHFHSIHGAIQESMHVFIKNAFQASGKNPVSILEVGFGTGLNAFLTLKEAINIQRKVIFHSIESYPLEPIIFNSLNHIQLIDPSLINMFSKIYQSEWNKKVDICEYFTLKKIHDDLLIYNFDNAYDVVYFDAFSPQKQSEMWSNAVFRKIFNSMNHNGVLTTYSAKGSVKRTLQETGFRVEMLPGSPGKREMIRAWKIN
jgi:tRNA U34 5-methylaminomethyl-2-thiouridine-forming methyltransferase MnmC